MTRVTVGVEKCLITRQGERHSRDRYDRGYNEITEKMEETEDMTFPTSRPQAKCDPNINVNLINQFTSPEIY